MSKHKGNKFQYQDQFQADLLRTYRQVRRDQLNRYGRINRLLLLQTVANSPAERFYTSEEQACRVIRAMLYKGETFPKMNPLKREMYIEILSRVKSRLRRNPDQPIQPIVEIIVNEPAPKFYVTPQSVSVIICRLKTRHRNYKSTGQFSRRDTPTSSSQED